MAQEGRIDPGIAERQRFAINPHRPVLQRADEIFGGVHQRHDIAAMVPALAVDRGDEDLQGRIAGTGAHAGERGIDADGAFLRRDDRIGDAEREIVMGVHAALGFGAQHAIIGAQPVTHAIHVERAARIGHIDALGTIAFHFRGLGGERFGVDHVAHHQEAGDIHAEIAGETDMLFGDIGFGAMGGDAHRADAQAMRPAQFIDGAEPGQDEGGEHRAGQHLGDGFEPFPIGMGAKAIVEAGARQAVAMRDFDGIDPGGIERCGDGADMIEAIHVADGVHAIAQRDILNVELGCQRIVHRRAFA